MGLTRGIACFVSVNRFLPCFGSVISPITAAWMPSFVSLPIMLFVSSFSAVMRSEPELMSWSGSMLKCLQIFCVSSGIKICCLYTLKPTFAASASSCSPPATPPSVGSCIAVTPPVL